MKTPFRYDFVGSFLRPQRLKDARKDFEEGKITQADLTKVEDECIVDLVNKIKDLATMLSQTESSEDPLGILTLCGDLKVLSIRRQ